MDHKPSEKIAHEERTKLFRRALAAYYADPETSAWPSTESGGFVRRGGLNYVLLYDEHDDGALLACYRVRHDGKLKRLARLPEGME